MVLIELLGIKREVMTLPAACHALMWLGAITFKFYSTYWASLVAQWLRICLPMQGTRV